MHTRYEKSTKMTDLPASVRPLLRRLSRRVAVGLFLDIWPRWAIFTLLIAGTAALVCRIFFADAEGFLPWLWITPVLSAIPALYLCVRRAYRPAEIVALADWLGGGQGTLLTLLEKQDPAWAEAPAIATLSQIPLPRLNPWQKLGPVVAALLFLSIALFVPQRVLPSARSTVLANDVVADLKTTLEDLKKQDLLTPEEQNSLEKEIERLRKDALERMDSSSWEAADTLRDKVAAELQEKHDAMKWASESAARYADAAQSGAPPSEALSQELAKALENLAKNGMLSNAPEDIKQMMAESGSGEGSKVNLPKDPKKLKAMAAKLAQFLGGASQRFAEAGRLARAAGRFNPRDFQEFSWEESEGEDGDGGRGGISRGRGDAELTWGDESLPFDKFKSVALPQGYERGPDDWAPVAVLPGAPTATPEMSGPSTGAQFSDTTGQAAWRRTLAPRHYSAVKKYFDDKRTR
jgi:hypothetical protein